MKEIPLTNGQDAKVNDEDYEYLSRYTWYAYCDSEKQMTYAAHDTPTGRRVFMHDVIMGLDWYGQPHVVALFPFPLPPRVRATPCGCPFPLFSLAFSLLLWYFYPVR